MPPARTNPPTSQALAPSSSSSAGVPAGSALGPMSLGVSLAVHGAAVASIVLAFYSPWAPSEPEEGSRDVVAARMEAPDRTILDEPEEERLAELQEPVEVLEPIPLDDFEDLFSEDLPDPFAPVEPETFEAPLAPPELNPLDLLQDLELPNPARPSEAVALPEPAESQPVESQPAEAAPSESSTVADVEAPVEKEGETTAEATASEAMVLPSPIPSECPPPIYPRLAERRGWTGTTVLLIDVAADGTVTGVRIESSSGHEVLDEAAVAAVRTWRFRPGTLGGQTAALVVRKPIRFDR
ncbi:transport protein TonB [Planctomycetes bacterium Poly30]|uniref:Transport protein TonB n=1 Tax=Saltatorellus ferox TaxID=2528018 RepID=A0A518EXU8_9BACT|nr:transport protein TonB [Planctomycetes bacterium Poly30]